MYNSLASYNGKWTVQPPNSLNIFQIDFYGSGKFIHFSSWSIEPNLLYSSFGNFLKHLSRYSVILNCWRRLYHGRVYCLISTVFCWWLGQSHVFIVDLTHDRIKLKLA